MLTTTVAAVALATRSGAVLMVAVTVMSACGADSPDGVAAPGLEGAPREITLEPPPLPTTTTTAPTPPPTSVASSDEPSSSGSSSSTEVDPSTTGPTSTVEASPPAEAATDTAEASDGDVPTTTADGPFLRRGDEGPEVVSLQQRLIELEYLAPGGDSGVFDGATADALIDFQAQYGLVVDGIFGPESDRALNAAAASVVDG